MDKVEINFNEVSSVDSFHDSVVKTLQFPSYYGRNKDAFWDCLTDYGDDMELSLVNVKSLNESLKAELNDYIKMFHEHAEANQDSFMLVES